MQSKNKKTKIKQTKPTQPKEEKNHPGGNKQIDTKKLLRILSNTIPITDFSK